MNCRKCGAVFSDHQFYCPNCGEKAARKADLHVPTKESTYTRSSKSGHSTTADARRYSDFFVIISILFIVSLSIVGFIVYGSANSAILGYLCIIPAVLLLWWLYFIPYRTAAKRGHPSAGGILVLNFFLGGTLICWIIALVWACSSTGAPVVINKTPTEMEQLVEYKKLLDAGVITEEEFQAKKAQLLGL